MLRAWYLPPIVPRPKVDRYISALRRKLMITPKDMKSPAMILIYAFFAAPTHSSLQVVHRNGPCAAKSDGKLTQMEALAQDSL